MLLKCFDFSDKIPIGTKTFRNFEKMCLLFFRYRFRKELMLGNVLGMQGTELTNLHKLNECFKRKICYAFGGIKMKFQSNAH